MLAATAQEHQLHDWDLYDPLRPEQKDQFSVATPPFNLIDKSKVLPVYYKGIGQNAIDPGSKYEFEGKLV